MTRLLVLFALAGGLNLAGVTSAAAQSHHWDSADGKFSIDGKLLRVEKGECVIQADDGREIRVGFGQLSLADLAYASDWKNGVLPQPAKPAAPTSGGFAPPRRPSRPPMTPAMPQPSPSPTPTLQPEPSIPFKPPTSKVPLSQFPPAQTPAMTPPAARPWKTLPIAGRQLFASEAVSPWLMQLQQRQVKVFDLRTPEAPVRDFLFDGPSYLGAISTSGKWVAAAASDNSGFFIAELARVPLKNKLNITRLGRIDQLVFAGDDRLLLVDGGQTPKEIIAIDPHGMFIKWRMKAEFETLVVSPSGKWFVPLAQKGDIPVYDCQTGKQVRLLKTPQTRDLGVFSADDKFFATLDTKTGSGFILAKCNLETQRRELTKASGSAPNSMREPLGRCLQWPDSQGPIFVGRGVMIYADPVGSMQEFVWPTGVTITGPVRFLSPTVAFGFTDTAGYINYDPR
ncbi:WD40 repeat domain-containing protein [Blastopirellula retiformator]|uniref:SLA1 homology domain-containing protein n=1 Tax=Blastopirellula retiformator TaxID=2527970 RepID=A0A5C5V349_9BACT|nr:hypothetical protein [Blastopirellula retiformator]TWT32811.1 hypothetical protein Enr8_26170 [Blastopirellula retiformator]